MADNNGLVSTTGDQSSTTVDQIENKTSSDPTFEEIKTAEEAAVISVYDSFITPESEGYSLDFIIKNRTNDSIRRNFLSKLTY